MSQKFKRIGSYFILTCICLSLIFFSEKQDDYEYKSLRNKALIIHTSGEISKIRNARKSDMLVYHYWFMVNGEKRTDSYTMYKEYDGIEPGSPVGVIYLKEDPAISRLIWTDDDFDWIE